MYLRPLGSCKLNTHFRVFAHFPQSRPPSQRVTVKCPRKLKQPQLPAHPAEFCSWQENENGLQRFRSG